MTKDLFKKVVLGAAIATPLTAGMMAVSAEELPVDADEEITSLDVVTEVDAVSADEVDASKEDGVLEDETVVEEAVLANEVLGEREPATDDGVLAGPYYSDEVSVYEYVKELRKTENQKDVFYEIIEDENDSNKHYIKRHKVDLNEVNGPFDTIDDAYYEGRELWQTLAYASANTHNLVYDIIEKGGKYYTQLVVPEFEVIESNTSYVESLQEMLEELASGDKYNAYTEVRDEDGEVVGYVLKSVQSNLNDNNYEVSYDEDKVVVEDFSILKPSVVLVKNPLLTDDEQVTVKESKYGYTTGSYLFYKYQDGSTDTSYKNRGRWEDSVLEIIHVSPDFVLEDGLFGDREVKWYNPDIPVREQGLVPEYSYESSFEGENPKYSLDMFKPEYALDFLDKEESKPEQDKEDELSQPTKDQVSDTITGEKPNKGQVSDTITGEKPNKGQVSDTITGEKPNKGQVSGTITGEKPNKGQVSDTITGEKPNKGQVSDTITGEKPADKQDDTKEEVNKEAKDEVVKEEKTASNPAIAQDSGKETLPETGEAENFAVFGMAALSVLAGVGLVTRRKEN